MAKRASASSCSGQPSQPKRPCQALTESERNFVLGSCSMEEDVQGVCGEELEHAKSHSAEYCQSCTGNAFKDLVQRMHSMENSFQELKEVVKFAIVHSPHLGRANAKSTAKNDVRNLQLQVRTKLSLSIFTGKKIEGKGGARISIALIDADTRDVITSGPEFSIKLDIVVLEGDFNKEDEDDWTEEEFEKYIVKEREGKGPLLTGNPLVMLKGGSGELGDLIFTDNSSWTRSKRFRIGLKVASGYCENTRIREGITNAFRVKEHRGELSEKHHPPATGDAVWRLETIAKDGKYHHKLSDVGIDKVDDFLLQLFTDSNKLSEILGMSLKSKNWDILVHHARTCKRNWKLYCYYSDDMRKHGVVFNVDGQLVGIIKDRVYCATHRLSAQEKEQGETTVKNALSNWNNVREFNGETLSVSEQKKCSSSCPSQALQIENLTPVQHNLVPQVSATPAGAEAPLDNVGFTAEGHTGATASASPVQSQDTDSGNAFPATPQGDSGITNVALPIHSDDYSFQYATQSHMIHSSGQWDNTASEDALVSEPPSAAMLIFQSCSTLGNHVVEDLDSFVSDDLHSLLASFSQRPLHDDEFFRTPLYDSGSVRGHTGATALALPVELQNTNSGNAITVSVDESVHLASHRPISTHPLNVLIPQGDNGITSVGLPINSHCDSFQYAMQSHMIHSLRQTDYMANENVPLSDPPSAAISSFQSSSTPGSHVIEDVHVSASFSWRPTHDDTYFTTPLYDGGSVRGTSKGVNGWLKIKAVMRWGFFVWKIVKKRKVRIMELDEAPNEVRA